MQDGDAHKGGAPTSLPTVAPVIHFAELWPKKEGRSGDSQTYAVPSEEAEARVLHAANLAGRANETQGTGAAVGDGAGKVDTPPAGIAFDFGEKGASAAVDAVSGKPALHFRAADLAAPSDAEGSGVAAKPDRGSLEDASSKGSKLVSLHGLFSPVVSEDVVARLADGPASKSYALDRFDLEISVAEGAWQAAPSDLVIF